MALDAAEPEMFRGHRRAKDVVCAVFSRLLSDGNMVPRNGIYEGTSHGIGNTRLTYPENVPVWPEACAAKRANSPTRGS